jgi:hypothetical protein
MKNFIRHAYIYPSMDLDPFDDPLFYWGFFLALYT